MRTLIGTRPTDLNVIRQLGDIEYAQGNYEEASGHYVTILKLQQTQLATLNDANETMTDAVRRLAGGCDARENALNSRHAFQISRKMVHCYYELRLFTLSAIVGQLQSDIGAHVLFVPHILRDTPQTEDAGGAYFPFIYSIAIFETMSQAYDCYDLNVHYVTLVSGRISCARARLASHRVASRRVTSRLTIAAQIVPRQSARCRQLDRRYRRGGAETTRRLHCDFESPADAAKIVCRANLASDGRFCAFNNINILYKPVPSVCWLTTENMIDF